MNDKAKRILVIEDEEALRDLYVGMLVDAGYFVDSAADGQIGLEKLKLGKWDLVLLDIVMPKLDGLSVLTALKKEPNKYKTGPIIILTVLIQDELINKGLSLGATGYLIKSEVNPDQVLAQVKSFLGEI